MAILPFPHFIKMKKFCEVFILINILYAKNSYSSIVSNSTDLGKLCEDGLPLLSSNDKPVPCNKTSHCPLGFWCHNGGIYPSLYYCCPKNKEINNICGLPKKIGYGFEVSLRYVFNIHSRECESFMYYGIGGNENNFESLEKCQLMCGMFSKKIEEFFSNENKFIEKISSSVFHINNDAPVTSNFDPCTQTPDIGISLNGNNTIEKRFYFDRILSKCIQFSYKGLGGNYNNFKSSQDCEKTCGNGKLQLSSCFEKYTNGTGNMKILRYYYDYKHRVCKTFFYKGNNGNNNRFISRKQCTELCIVSLQPDKVLVAGTTAIATTTTTTLTSITTLLTTTTTTITTTTIESKLFSRLNFNSYKKNNTSKGVEINVNEEKYIVPKIIKIIPPNNYENERFYQNEKQNIFNNNNNNNQLNINGYESTYNNGYGMKYPNEEVPFPNTNNQEVWGFENYYQPLPHDSHISITNMTNKSSKRRRPIQEISSSAYKEFINNLTDIKNNNDNNVCKLPLEPGVGNLLIQRWYYNPTFQNCIPFFFKGQSSNGNNFFTKIECINRCMVNNNNKTPKHKIKEQYNNICSQGTPSLNSYHKLIICTSHDNCLKKTHYCSFDITNVQGYCCPKSYISPCEQELVIGNYLYNKNVEKETTIRYYFNKDTYTCTSFKYTGFGGNENNFLTIGECRRQCPEYINPCPIGIPYISKINENVAFCSHINQECPQNYWCHIGGSKKTSTCCPMINDDALNEDPCSMNLIIGEGHEKLSRYFYNKRTKQCESFIYLGKKGNANNFYTKTDCEAMCPVFENPCGFGSPFFNTIMSSNNNNNNDNDPEEESQPMFCSITENEDESNCPEGYYCHIGGSSHSTVCCPITGDPCDMPVAKGNGTLILNRWYFNSKTKVCSSFVYSGIGGNINNFLSKEDCSQTCDVMLNPCPTGHPHITLSGEVTQCGDFSTTGNDENGSCPPTYWCHYGSSYESSTCCPNAGNPCILDMEEGEGNLNVIRYYYDYKSRKCKKMIYKGMKGNQNSFLTLTACEARCPVFKNPCLNGEPEKLENGEDIKFCSLSNFKNGCGEGYYCHIGYSEESTVCCLKVNDDPCSQPIIRGGGPSSLSRFYFDSSTRTCLPFIYSGGNGNMNNFISKDECESTCPVLQNPCSNDEGPPATDDNGQYIFCASRADNTCPSGYFCHYGEFLSESICCPDGDGDVCNKQLQEGIGDKELIRWYFNNNLRRCSKFKYKGKAGNSNNFITLQECQMTCKEYQNPCSDGDPALNTKGEIIFCSTINNTTCPDNYFCHHGAVDSTTVCCPLQQQSDPCFGPLSIGNGLSKLSRWYFNHHTRQCLQFTYTGVNGNANNYLTEEDCSNSCPVVINPCPGIDRIYPKAFADSLKCSSDTSFLCPIGYWCHLGSTPETTICCPNAQDPCKQELEIGIKFKTENVKRWYYDSNIKECKSFIFKGLKGNQNNFLTKDDCIKTCPSYTNVCQIQEPYRDKIYNKIVNCDNNKNCPSGYFCHRGSSSTSIKDKNINNVCCRSLKHPCQDEVIIGNGKNSLPRWYFNFEKKQCIEFTYSGSGGSSNNFINREECIETCLYDNTNPCRNGEPYKNIYGEIKNCSPQLYNQCPSKYFCHYGDDKKNTVCCPSILPSPCLENMEIGYGNKQLSRYYYNNNQKECLPFIYTGMGGNSNNFLTKEDCVKNCYLHSSSTPILFSTAEWPWYTQKEIKKRSITLKCGMPQAKSCKGSPIGYFYESLSDECVPIRPCPNEPYDNIFWNLNECTNICSNIGNRRSATDKEEDYLLIRSLGFLSQLLSNPRNKENLR